MKWKYLAIDSSPITIGSDGIIYVSTQQNFHAITPNGETIWENNYLGGGHITSVSIDDQKNLYIAGRFGAWSNTSKIYKLDSEIGFIISSSTIQQKIKNFPIGIDDNENLYSVADYNVLIHDSNDLSFKKSIGSDYKQDHISGNLAIDNENSAVYFGTEKGWIIKIDTNAMEKVVSENWPIYIGDWRVGGITIDANGIIYAGTQVGKFYAFNPDGTVKWLYDTEEGIIHQAIIDSDGTVYVVSGSKLYAF